MTRATIRVFAYIFIPTLLIIGGVDAIIFTLTQNKVRDVAAANAMLTVEKSGRVISEELSIALKDLTYLAFIHESYDIFQGKITQDLEDTFMAVMYNRQDYELLQYLDTKGREVFRISNNKGSPRIVPKSRLQAKNDHPYFTSTLHLDLDEVHISAMSLNKKNGRIESPYKPILRLGSPIWNPDGTTVGILVINFLGRTIIDALNALDAETCCDIMLFNEEGYMLKGPGVRQEWSFMKEIKTLPPSFMQEHPEPWQTISTHDKGQFRHGSRLYTFATVDLNRSIIDSTRLTGAHLAPTWKIVAQSPNLDQSPELSELARKMTLISLPLLLVGALASYRIAYLRTRSRAAEEMVLRQVESNARFVPNEFLGLLDKGELTEVNISDSVERSMTTMFTDIRSYTKLSEGMSAQQVLDFLNEYYGVLDPQITRHHGFIDAYIGDAVMALFPDGAENALKAVIDIRSALARFRYDKGKGEMAQVQSGFGLHIGDVTLGAVGTDHRLQTTAIGDAVNLASRIESATKIYGVNIIITGAVKDALPAPDRFHLRSIDLVRVKGKQEVVELFEVFDTDPEGLLRAKSANLGLFSMAMAQYRRGEFEQALEGFSKLKESTPGDTVLDIFIKRSNTMMRIPPGGEWTGVSTL